MYNTVDSIKAFWQFCETEGYQAFATKVIPAAMPEEAVVVEGGNLKEASK